MDKQHPQQQWREAVVAYAQAINRYVAQGRAHGWDELEEPQAPATGHLLDAWRAALLAINQPGIGEQQRQLFREAWPPAHLPLVPLLDEHAQGIGHLLLLDDGSLLARIGMPFDKGQVVRIDDHSVTPVIGVEHFGRCPQRRYHALANAEGVRITDGWGGPLVARLAWPHGLEGLPPGYPFEPLDLPPTPTALIPFPDGQRVLLVSSDGIFVLAAGGATRLLPREQTIVADLRRGIDPDDIALELAMEHAALSPDGRLIALGEQCGRHLLLDAQLQPLAEIEPASEYPHFALFNRRGDHLLLNACHFYHGTTLGVGVADLDGQHQGTDPRTLLLQDGARIHAGVARDGEYIVGDAQGYLRAFGEDGREHWQHYLGSTISAMDISADGKTLAVASHAGFISLVALDSGRPEWQIGTGPHGEVRRWVCWKGLDGPLAW
ncbi:MULTISPECIES: hypothetical protein [unclassified Pseudomonas]|uniref:hypothetical protein n=1 Tax=unclassified Pseudomonas TaxID=196821 RepID=UPI0024497538|nr:MULTISPECIES: hypothetical protein [unclassified Pseudomonas]MDH0300837.1 hypothetical protein [Pseudomonas sp. GD04091]MDH1985254.1 hypothetical protein [Pseudomonas sp. GD03689]